MDSFRVINSYKTRSEEDMFRYIISNRINWDLNRKWQSLLNEWKAHNILFQLGLFKSHTRSVDFENNPKWYFTLGYWILSRFYFIFER